VQPTTAVAAEAAAKDDETTAATARWMAMHYEAHGLHSLTDLWSTGHIVIQRRDTTKKIREFNR
jgi:hypothetical protein